MPDKKFLCCIPYTSADERKPLLGKEKTLESPVRKDPDGSDQLYKSEGETYAYTPLDTESRPEATPEVQIKPSSKGKRAKSRSKEESASKSPAEPIGAHCTEGKESKVLEFKKFEISELDCIFSDFKTTFDPFVQNRQDLEKSEKSFKKAVQSLQEIHPKASIKEYIATLKGRLKDEGITVKLKEGALTIYKEGAATVQGISDAVSALNTMLKTGKDLKEMPLTVEKGSADAVDRAEDLDLQGILRREFTSVWDLGKIPKLKKAFKNNVEQIRGTPKMVRDFYRKTKEIILEIYHAFADEEDKKEMEREMAEDDDNDDESKDEERDDQKGNTKKKNAKKEKGATAEDDSEKKKKEKDDFHKKLKFESVGLPDIDNVFTSLASAVNPFVETRERLQTARESFENVVTTICNFDGKKELKDYLRELKKNAKEGNIRIYIDEVDDQIKVKAIEGVKPPKPYRDAVQALNNIKSSGKEAVELEPHVQHGIEACVGRIKQIDPNRDFHSMLKKKADVFTLPGKIKKFNDNRKQAQEIPGIVKEFCLYVERLLNEILEALTGEKAADPEKKEEEGIKGDEGSVTKDGESDKSDRDGDDKDQQDDEKDEERELYEDAVSRNKDDEARKTGDPKEDEEESEGENFII